MISNSKRETGSGSSLELEFFKNVYALDFSGGFILNQLETSCLASSSSSDRQERAKALREEGLSIRRIAQEMGLSVGAISGYLKAY